MSNTNKYRNRLITLLKELFQLDQPELDFGLYKIMHAKSVQITRFLENDLLKEIRDAFGEADEYRISEARSALESAIEQAKRFGAPDPETTDGVKEARAAYDNARAGNSAEAEVYDHLYRFFERYYDSGDFMSRRYYARESDSRAAPYAVPYDGREVYLHWANKDQYYIKSSEYLSNYTFELNEAIRQEAERQKQGKSTGLELDGDIDDSSRRVHMRIVAASEGEHGNIKAGGDKRQFFIIHSEAPVFLENGELVIQFQYRADPEKSGQDKTWQQTRLDQAEEAIFNALGNLSQAKDYFRGLKIPAPTESQRDRTLLVKHLQKYSARNTMDYFIHKDLGSFLSRELDFYIKNEIMRLDDIEHAEAPSVEQYLTTIRVLRRIAHQLISFLAQLENFQRKLWLKKKFITETQYCITLDRIPESIYPEIAANEAQRKEWIELFAIDKADEGLPISRYRVPLTVEFLKANPFLPIDTALFDESFKLNLLNEIQGLDSQCSGVLINAENYQALNLVKKKLNEQVNCIYIDPPFNLGQNGDYLYRTDYKDSTWAALLFDRVAQAKDLLSDSGILYLRCDHNGNYIVRPIINTIFGEEGFQYELSVQRIRKNVTTQGKLSLPLANDSLFMAFNSTSSKLADPYLKLKETRKAYWRRIDDSAGYRNPPERTIFGKTFKPYKRDAHFKYSQSSIDLMVSEGRIKLTCKTRGCDYEQKSGNWVGCPQCGSNDATPKYLVEATDVKILDTNWMDVAGYSSSTGFSTENAESLLQRALQVATHPGDLVADYFAGSGTTLAVSLKNRRRWFGVEMGRQFDDYILPRLKKACQDTSVSHCFKYCRLESYEDTLNNLFPRQHGKRNHVLEQQPGMRRDYVLNYFLEVETEGSQSLLNIANFRDPSAYKMWIKKPGSEEQELHNIDLIETFNWLLGLWVEHLPAPQIFSAEFQREKDKDLPQGQNARLVCKRLRLDDEGAYWYRLVEGYTLRVPGDNSSRVPTLIVWRKQTDDAEKDSAALQKYLETIGVSSREKTYEVIYVNGSHTLANPVVEGAQTKVRLIEEAFHRAMWAEI